MLIDLLFSNSDRLGKFPGAHLFFAQELNHLLTNGLQPISFLTLLENSRKELAWNIFKGLTRQMARPTPLIGVARLARLERATCGLEVRCSIQLSYRRISFPAQRAGIEGASILFHWGRFVHMVSPLTTS